jgi:V-type H+-transporting ATPase subunit E
MPNHQDIPDPHEIFENRMLKFKEAINDYRRKQLKAVVEKADKEQEFELAKIKNDARNRDTDSFRKMDDNIKVAEKIFKSRKINECKMKEMKVRYDMVERIQEETRQKLTDLTKNPTVYRGLLKGLVQQGLIKLLE